MRDRRCPRPQREGLGLVTKDGGRVDRGRKLVAYAAYVLGRYSRRQTSEYVLPLRNWGSAGDLAA